MVKGRRILITGCAGFIGTNLALKLLQNENVHVTGLDNFFTGSRKNVILLLRNRNFEFIRHDVTKPKRMEFDEIYHLASPASPKFYQKDPVRTIKTNVIGTMNMLENSRRSGAKIVLSSTSEIYGEPLEHPQRETYRGNVSTTGIRACYDESKRLCETLVCDYRREYGADAKIVRIFNTYGPMMQHDDGRVIPNFIIQALKGEPLTVFGRGHQTRSFCYVDDTVNGLIKMMNTDYRTAGPINIGSDDEYRIIDIAKMIISKTGSKSKIVFKELPEDDPSKRKPDLLEAKRILKWEPKTSIDEGLEMSIRYFRRKK